MGMRRTERKDEKTVREDGECSYMRGEKSVLLIWRVEDEEEEQQTFGAV